ncbi:MAG: HK97 gp10 family phage protein [Oliverpabstia sp.]|nr:HK97 gp10 family phage protein [Oliverpabstia sp.]
MSLEFKDNSNAVKEMLERLCIAAVTEAGIELLEQVQENTKVVTGRTKESWQMGNKENSQGVAVCVGSNYENAIWEEFGTGEYALHGDGRKGGWFYEDEKGEGHFTKGKQPKRPLHNAFASKRGTCERIIKDKIGDLK